MTARPADAAERVRAALLDATTLEIVWANEAASACAVDGRLEIAYLVPAEAGRSAEDVVREATRTGQAVVVRGEIASNARGSLVMVTSANPVPGEMLLVLSDSVWVTAPRPGEIGSADRGRARRR